VVGFWWIRRITSNLLDRWDLNPHTTAGLPAAAHPVGALSRSGVFNQQPTPTAVYSTFSVRSQGKVFITKPFCQEGLKKICNFFPGVSLSVLHALQCASLTQTYPRRGSANLAECFPLLTIQSIPYPPSVVNTFFQLDVERLILFV